MSDRISFKSFSSEKTRQFAAGFAREKARDWRAKKRSGALVIALFGELGTGKTCFARGFAEGLGVKGRMISPTFVVVRRFPIVVFGFKSLFHIDLYRLCGEGECVLDMIGLDEVLSDRGNIVVVEWPEAARGKLPEDAIWVKMRHGEKENERMVRISLT